MGRKLKNLLSNPDAKCSLRFVVVLFLIILGVALPFYKAQALFGIGSLAAGAVKTILNIFVGGFFQILAALGNVLLGLAAALLGWVLSGFTSLSYTNPAGNPILDIGWTLVRDLANIGIILALVIIALGTALRIGGYQAKKALPTLIFIALLINFTPVICGLIVDAGNIVMNFFVEDLTGWDTFLWVFGNQYAVIEKGLLDRPPWEDLSFLGASMGLAAFAFIGAAILLVYAILFAMRYVAIWVLVILSPIAFFCYILPATKRVFSQWWNQFIQWTFIGAVAGFFLYLSNHILYMVVRGEALISKNPGEAIGGGAIDALLPYFVVISFLWIGFFVSLSTSAMGASGVIAGARGVARGAPGWVAKRRPVERGLGKAAGGVGKGLAGAEQGIKRLEEKAAGLPGGKVWGKALEPIRWAVRPVTSAAPTLLKYAAEKRKIAIPKGFDEMSPLEQQKYIDALNPVNEDRLQFVAHMAGKGTLKYTGKEFQKKATEASKIMAESPHYQKEIKNVYNILPEEITAETRVKMKMAVKVTQEEKIKVKEEAEKEIKGLADKISEEAKINPELEVEITKKVTPQYSREDVMKDMAAAQLHVKTLTPKDIPNVANPTSMVFVKGMVEYGSTPQISAAGKEHGKDFVDAYMKEAEKKGLAWFDKNKPEVLKYFEKSPSAQGLGFGFREPSKSPLGAEVGKKTEERKAETKPEEKKGGYVGGAGPTG